MLYNVYRVVQKQIYMVKSGYMGFARLKSSADATPAVMLSPTLPWQLRFTVSDRPLEVPTH